MNFILRVIQSGIHEHVDLVYQDWMLRLFGVADFAEKNALNIGSIIIEPIGFESI